MSSPPPLLYGPYAAPTVQVGAALMCLRAGIVVVGGYTSGPIPWPRVRKTGRPQLILCGDLVLAVRLESELAVAYWWGVGVTTVWAWRKALGIGRVTRGTRELLRANGESGCLRPELAAKGRAMACCYDSVAKMAASKEGVPRKRPVSRATRRKISQRQRERWTRERIAK